MLNTADLEDLYEECKIDAAREAWMENTPRCDNCGEYMDRYEESYPYQERSVTQVIYICPFCG